MEYEFFFNATGFLKAALSCAAKQLELASLIYCFCYTSDRGGKELSF